MIEKKEVSQESLCAVRLPETFRNAQPLEDYLRGQGLSSAKQYPSKDDDDLNDAVLAGRFQRVVFKDYSDLLDAIWAGHVRVDRWIDRGVELDLAQAPDTPGDWRKFAYEVATAYAEFKNRERKRQVRAALLLSLMAIIAVAALFWTLPSPR